MKWLTSIGNKLKDFFKVESDYIIIRKDEYYHLKLIDEKRLSIQKISNDIQEHWIEMQNNRRPEQVTEARFFLTPSEGLEFTARDTKQDFDIKKGSIELGAH